MMSDVLVGIMLILGDLNYTFPFFFLEGGSVTAWSLTIALF